MTGGDFSADDQTTDIPALCHSACITCPNKNTCRSIVRAVATLGSDDVHRAATPSQRKRFASISDHLRREGFSYPNVAKAGQCWMHYKFGVATFYENQLTALAEQIASPLRVNTQTARLAPRV